MQHYEINSLTYDWITRLQPLQNANGYVYVPSSMSVHNNKKKKNLNIFDG